MEPPSPVRGRGAQSATVPQRFGLASREADGDWLDARGDLDEAPPPLRTTVTEEHPKSILTFNKSPDVPFDRSVNAYRGCEHGCIYCFARPTHAFHDLSPGLDFETKLFAKPDAPRLLREALARPGYRPAPIAMGTNTDPYQPIESRYRITRQVLELCLETGHPVTITTKSDRVVRDIDLLAELARLNLAWVSLSITSLDPRLSGLLEPRAAAPAKRVEAIRRLSEAGVPTHVSVSPVIPFVTDEWIERIVEAAAGAGARSASWIFVRLPHEVAPLFREWLCVHFPDRAARVMATIREARGGKDNEARFHARFKAEGAYAQMLRARFNLACRRLGLARSERLALDCTRFRPPRTDGQLSLL